MPVDIAVIVSIVALAITILVHLVATVWWASKMTANQTSMKETIDKLSSKLDDHSDVLYTKHQAHDDFVARDAQLAALWKRQDELKDDVTVIKAKCQILHQKHSGEFKEIQ
jgi:hypothetical protein